MKKWVIAIGLTASILTGATLGVLGYSGDIAWTAAVVVLCAIWWIFEPIPIPVTSLIPLAIFPLVGVLNVSEVGAAYGDPLVLLMMGGFMLSMAMERSGAHRRIALSMVNAFGGSTGGREAKAVLGSMVNWYQDRCGGAKSIACCKSAKAPARSCCGRPCIKSRLKLCNG